MTSVRNDFKVADLSLGSLRPQGDHPGRARDARPDVHPQGVRRQPAARRRPYHRLAAHDRADRRADRDPGRPRRRGPLVLLQHLLHPGPRRRRHRGRPQRHPRGPAGRPGLRLEGRDPRRVLVVHRAGPDLAEQPYRRPQHDPGRRRRRHPPGPQGRRVREGRRRPGPVHRRQRRVPHHPPGAQPHADRDPHQVDPARLRDPRRHRGDHHRRPPPVRDAPRRRAALPGDQRQRRGHQVQVRQQVRLPSLADRRHQPRHRRPHRRQGRGRLRLRRRGQGLRRVAARPGRPGHRHRDRPDLRAAGRHGRLPGRHPGRRRRRSPTSSSPRRATRTSSWPPTWPR